MRRFGKDRCGYDARNTGLRHNRSLPRCRNLCGPAWSGGRAPARPDAHQHDPAREVPAPPSARGAVGCLPPFRFLAAAERSWSIFPGHRSFYSSRKKGGGRALMARIPPVADTDGTDLALPLEVARRSVLSVTAKPEPSFPPTFQDEISVRNKSNCQSSSITADTAPRERILFHKWSHRGSELRFLRRISHRNPGPCPPHIQHLPCVQ